ncbi:MAG: hypothetical protein U0075_10825 [Thermomicrobiales bacterium]
MVGRPGTTFPSSSMVSVLGSTTCCSVCVGCVVWPPAIATLPLPPEASALAFPPLALMFTSFAPWTLPTVTEPPLAFAFATPPLPALAVLALVLVLAGAWLGTVSRRSGVESERITTAQNRSRGRVIFWTSGAPSCPWAVPVQTVR